MTDAEKAAVEKARRLIFLCDLVGGGPPMTRQQQVALDEIDDITDEVGASGFARALVALADRPAQVPLTNAMLAILKERDRQRGVEGWTEAHDDDHQRGELAAAAACYAYSGSRPYPCDHPDGPWQNIIRTLWPWHHLDWWKPKNQRRDLERAGALIIAEIERLDRAELAERARRGT